MQECVCNKNKKNTMKKKGNLLKEEIKKMKQNSDFNKQIKDKINKREGKLLKEVIKRVKQESVQYLT